MTKAKTKTKNPPKKKVVVIRRNPSNKPADKPLYAHKVKDTCQSSAVFNGSVPLQALLTTWVMAADTVAENLTKQDVARTTLLQLEADLPSLLINADNGEAEFSTAVQTASKDDVTIAVGMGLGVKADKKPAVQAVVPTGVRIEKLKKTNAPKLAWDVVPGAALYLAQMSVDPSTDASWVPLYGQGKSRKLPPLVVGQHYVLRVCALDNHGKPTSWSEVVSLVG